MEGEAEKPLRSAARNASKGESDMNVRTRQWFDQGYESFSQTFPEIAAKVPYRLFYVCPLL